ncbi:MAG: Asp-tRNA(Asn)/Glu-tRNA(Gln) amidotransferase subunit GatA [Bacilli bacterium]
MTNYLDLSLEQIHNKLKKKLIKPIDLVNEAFEKIEKEDYNAFITLCKKDAIQKAIELENKEVDNLFFGIPITVKDIFCTKGVKTTCGSKMLENFVPIYDATVIKFIKDANMIIIGKTNMDEFAMGASGETSYFGATKNPFDLNYITGGSSSGSAATVSSKISSISIGTDTGGSVRQPASYTGCVGMKPTYGRISRYGVIAYASSLDHVGIFSNNVKDNAHMLNLLSKDCYNDLTKFETNEDFTLELEKSKKFKIAVPNFFVGDIVDEKIKNSINKIINLLKENNYSIDYIDMPYLNHSVTLYQIISMGEASSNLARFDGIKYGFKPENVTNLNELIKETRSNGFGEEVKMRLMIGAYILSSENAHIYYEKALKLRGTIINSFNKVFEEYDLIIGPVTASMPSKIGDNDGNPIKSFYDDLFTIPANLCGLPAISLPINKNQFPIGLQIIGNKYKENDVYNLAHFIETLVKGGAND